MAIKLGSTDFTGRFGAQEVNKIYLGADIVYVAGIGISLDGSSNLVVDISSDASLVAADYVVYDWQRDPAGGTNYTSLTGKLLPMHALNGAAVDNVNSVGGTSSLYGSIYSIDAADGYTPGSRSLVLNDSDYTDSDESGLTLSAGTGTNKTLSFWIKVLTAPDGNNGGLGGDASANRWYIDSDLHFRHGETYPGTNRSASPVFTLNQWHHVVIQASDQVRMYVDDTEVWSLGQTTTSFDRLAYIGYPNQDLHAKFDQVQFYDRSLSAGQRGFEATNTYNKIASVETTVGESWVCRCIPITGGVAGTPVISSSITI